MDLPVYMAPILAERVLTVLGLEGRLKYLLRPQGNWHHYDFVKRTVEWAGPTCTVLEVLHELAHVWWMRHDWRHLMAIELLAQAWGEL